MPVNTAVRGCPYTRKGLTSRGVCLRVMRYKKKNRKRELNGTARPFEGNYAKRVLSRMPLFLRAPLNMRLKAVASAGGASEKYFEVSTYSSLSFTQKLPFIAHYFWLSTKYLNSLFSKAR